LHVDRTALSRGEILPIEATDDAATPIMSVGRALAGVDVELRDPSGAALPQGRIGRIFVRGPSVMVGYYQREDLTARAVQDGWLDTGDLGFFYDGQLYIYGREKDIIILNGRNHDPQSIEFTLDAVTGLQHDRAAAVAVEDELRGTEGFVVLCEKERGKADADALARAARDAIIAGSGLIPEAVVIIETGRLPRTTSGKVRRAEAARQYLGGELETLAVSLR
jgi:acyl-CoA synthetase (AMP-forming)/AMP-acid ligase II